MNPRKKIDKYIQEERLEKLLKEAAKLHGHYCPGLALGVMAAQCAVKKLNSVSDGLEDLVAITETNNCFSDGIQYVTGCTFGNNALVFNDIGKTAFSLCKRDGTGYRISTLASSKEYVRSVTKEFSANFNQVVKDKNRDKKEVKNYKKSGKKAAFAVLGLEIDQIFKIEEIITEVPPYAPSHDSFNCESCDEAVMSSRKIKSEDKQQCMSCSTSDFMQLNGNGIIIKTSGK